MPKRQVETIVPTVTMVKNIHPKGRALWDRCNFPSSRRVVTPKEKGFAPKASKFFSLRVVLWEKFKKKKNPSTFLLKLPPFKKKQRLPSLRRVFIILIHCKVSSHCFQSFVFFPEFNICSSAGDPWILICPRNGLDSSMNTLWSERNCQYQRLPNHDPRGQDSGRLIT